jgi:hypothetical protein
MEGVGRVSSIRRYVAPLARSVPGAGAALRLSALAC